jgi:hypothetical protein
MSKRQASLLTQNESGWKLIEPSKLGANQDRRVTGDNAACVIVEVMIWLPVSCPSSSSLPLLPWRTVARSPGLLPCACADPGWLASTGVPGNCQFHQQCKHPRATVIDNEDIALTSESDACC